MLREEYKYEISVRDSGFNSYIRVQVTRNDIKSPHWQWDVDLSEIKLISDDWFNRLLFGPIETRIEKTVKKLKKKLDKKASYILFVQDLNEKYNKK